MRIASVIRPESVNANYRARIPLMALAERGHEFMLSDAHAIPHAQEFAGFDVVHFCRLWEEPFQQLARSLRESGIGVTWDCDDYLPAIERETSSWRLVGGFNGRQVAKDMQVMMNLAHVVTTPCHVLADRFEADADDVRLIENYLAPPMVLKTLAPPMNPRLRVGWIAGLEHSTDVGPLRLQPMLQKILDYHPQVEVVSIGLALGLKSPRYFHIAGTDLLELPKASTQFDVAIAPIADTLFNRARSNIKVKEYAVGGAAWLASDVAPYHGLGERQGGRLIANDRWEEEIMALIGDVGRRRRMSQAARKWGIAQNIMLHLHHWEQAFADAISYAKAGPVGSGR